LYGSGPYNSLSSISDSRVHLLMMVMMDHAYFSKEDLLVDDSGKVRNKTGELEPYRIDPFGWPPIHGHLDIVERTEATV